MILVTGGTGFIGSYIIKNLLEKGHAVRAIRRSSKLPFFISQSIWDKVQWIDGNILDTTSLETATKEVDTVIHSAAIVSFHKEERKKMYAVNVEGTANIINASLENRVRRFIHISSVAALGRTTKEATVTEDRKWEENKNNTHYAISKRKAELEAWRGFAEGLEGSVVNPSTVLGFGNWHSSSCAIFRNAYKEFSWYTEGINGFVGVEDVAEAVVQLALSDINEQRFIVNSENWPFRQLFECIADGFGKKHPYKKATRGLSEIAWRIEHLKSVFTNQKALLTRETAKVAQSKTRFENTKLLKTLPSFSYTPLEQVVKNACDKYLEALQNGALKP